MPTLAKKADKIKRLIAKCLSRSVKKCHKKYSPFSFSLPSNEKRERKNGI
jgi:hypothetical protein